jgi:hypothetical protein
MLSEALQHDLNLHLHQQTKQNISTGVLSKKDVTRTNLEECAKNSLVGARENWESLGVRQEDADSDERR